MNKTTSVNIGGIAFILDEKAFEILKHYLDAISNSFHNDEERKEIMEDIETRIAEILSNKRETEKREVIIEDDIREVIKVMGRPEDYNIDEDVPPREEAYMEDDDAKRKLYRDVDDGILGGVCSGMAYHFGWDVIWIRLFFLLLFFGFGTGLFIYIILWFIIPPAHSTAQKLEMKGESVNIDNIKSSFKSAKQDIEKEIQNVKERSKHWRNKRHSKKFKNAAEQVVENFGDTAGQILLVLSKIFGGILILASIGVLIGLIQFMFGGDIVFISHFGEIRGYSLNDIGGFLVENGWQNSTLYWGTCVILFSLMVAFFYQGLRMVTVNKTHVRGFGWGITAFFVIGVIMTSISGYKLSKEFWNKSGYSETLTLPVKSDTLYISASEMYHPEDIEFSHGDLASHMHHHDMDIDINLYDGHHHSSVFYLEEDTAYIGDVTFNVTRGDKENFELIITKTARGETKKEALDRSQHILYNYNLEGNKLILDDYLKITKDDLLRNQQVEIELKVPTNKVIYLDPTTVHIIYDIKNAYDLHDSRMVDKYWTFEQGELHYARKKPVLSNEEPVSDTLVKPVESVE